MHHTGYLRHVGNEKPRGRAAGVCSQGLAPTLTRLRWGREAPVPDGAAGVRWCGWEARRRRVLPGDAPQACAPRVSPPPCPAPAGGGKRQYRMVPLVCAGSGEVLPEARAPRGRAEGVCSQGLAPTLSRPRRVREILGVAHALTRQRSLATVRPGYRYHARPGEVIGGAKPHPSI